MIHARRMLVVAMLLAWSLVAPVVPAGVVPPTASGTPAATGTGGRTQVYLLGSQGGQQRTQATGANARAGTSALMKAVLEAQGAPPRYVDHQLHDHSGGDLVGRTATGAGVPKLVLYHLIPGNPAISDEHWRALVSPYYAGEIVVGRDLLAF
jgi:hypothetical protein